MGTPCCCPTSITGAVALPSSTLICRSTMKRSKARRAVLRAALTPEAIRADLGAQLDYLSRHPKTRGATAGVVGYCMTGSFALRAAADFPARIAAAASFHGGGLASDAPDSPHLRADRIKASLYLGYADNDASMSPEMIERLEAALRANGVPPSAPISISGHVMALPWLTDSPSISTQRNAIGAICSIFSTPHSRQM